VAFLALWNDFARGREAEYDTWHTREHVPERVGCPGFLRARRYANRAHPSHRWFTLYDVDGVAAFETPAYQDLIAKPTPWSASMRPDFRNFLRVPCEDVAAAGLGFGGALAVMRLAREPPVLELAALHGVVRARLGRRIEGGAFRAGGAETGAPDDFTHVLLLDALDRAAAGRAFAIAAARCAPASLGGCYDLAFVFPDRHEERAALAR
jgi:hypothetical protein